MEKNAEDFCPEYLPCGQKKSRRWVAKLGLGGVVAAATGFLALNGPSAVHDAKAENMRPPTDDELAQFYTFDYAGETWLQQPNEDHPYFVGPNAELIRDEVSRATFIAADRSWVDAFKRKDNDFFRTRIHMPVDRKLASASAHSCSGSPSYYGCAIWGYQTRVQTGSCPGWTYSCWAFFHCADGHGSYCWYYCGSCTPH